MPAKEGTARQPQGVRGRGGGDTDQLLLVGGVLHRRVDVQSSRTELGVLLGKGAQQR
jgi:hypothetical protein